MTQTLSVALAQDFLDQGKGIADIDAAGIAATSVDLNFLNSGNEILLISNGGAGALTVTVNGVPDPFGRSTNEVTTIPAAKVGLITMTNPAMFNSGGSISITLSAITSVKLLLIRQRKNR